MKPAKVKPADTLPPGLESSPAFRQRFVADWLALAELAVNRRAAHPDAQPALVARARELLADARRQHERDEWALLAHTMYALGRVAEALQVDVLTKKGRRQEVANATRGTEGGAAVKKARDARAKPIQDKYRLLRKHDYSDRQAVARIKQDKQLIGSLKPDTIRRYCNDVRGEFD